MAAFTYSRQKLIATPRSKGQALVWVDVPRLGVLKLTVPPGIPGIPTIGMTLAATRPYPTRRRQHTTIIEYLAVHQTHVRSNRHASLPPNAQGVRLQRMLLPAGLRVGAERKAARTQARVIAKVNSHSALGTFRPVGFRVRVAYCSDTGWRAGQLSDQYESFSGSAGWPGVLTAYYVASAPIALPTY